MSGISVLGMVEDRHVIEDIGWIVPKGTVVTIPEELAVRSKDLYRALSSQHVVRATKLPLNEVSPEVARLRRENERLQGDVDRLQAQVSADFERISVLERDLSAAQSKLQTTNEYGSKLDAILVALSHQRPAFVVSPGLQETASRVCEAEVVSEAPIFLPSQIRPDNVETHEAVPPEESISTGDVSATGKALRLARKRQAIGG